MFGKKRKLGKYQFHYGKSPLEARNNSRYKPPSLLTKFSKILTLILSLILFVALSYLIFFSNYFEIKNIVIANKDFGNEAMAEEIKNSITNTLGKNILFIDTKEISNKIINFFPELETVSIGKDYPDTLSIEFSQYPLVANIINESNNIRKNYIINSVGYTIKENLENPSLPYIRIKSDEPVNIENPLIEKTKLDYILNTIVYFEDKFGMAIKEVEYKKIPREIHLLTERDFYIWLDMQREAEEQLKKLKKALVKLDIYKENLQYIDLRIAGGSGDKIIYKRK